jgi:hypothetical protein
VNGVIQAIARGDPRMLSASLVIGSMLLYFVGANLASPYRVTPGGRGSRLLGPLAGSSSSRAVYEIWRLVYYVGLPYVALYLGWVDLRAMGLGFLDWARGLRWAIVLGLASWSLLMFVWVPYLRAAVKMPITLDPQGLSWSRRVVEVVYMQAHWAFYHPHIRCRSDSR